MADSKLRPLLIAIVLLPAACGGHRDNDAQSSITIELPPARPATPRPGFYLDATVRAAQPGDERASEAVHELAESSR